MHRYSEQEQIPSRLARLTFFNVFGMSIEALVLFLAERNHLLCALFVINRLLL